jgi:biopolymer transport protein ExbD
LLFYFKLLLQYSSGLCLFLLPMKSFLALVLCSILLVFNGLYYTDIFKIISYELKRSISSEELKAFFKEQKIPKVFLAADKGVNIYEIIYTTGYFNDSVIKASGLLFAPVGERADLPFMIYDHGTEFCNERPIDMKGEQSAALAFATSDYVVIYPDYVGKASGQDCNQLYLHAATEAGASVDMLRAVVDGMGLFGIKGMKQLFVTGYSQGGHAAMATHRLLQEKYQHRFTVTASAPMSGPYDMLMTVTEGRNKYYEYPGFLAYLFKAYFDVNNDTLGIHNVFAAPYNKKIPILLDGNYPVEEIGKVMPHVAFTSVSKEFYQEYETNPEMGFKKFLVDNSVYDWKPEAPMQLCYCNGDKQVTYKNSLKAYETMKKNGSKHVELWRSGKKFNHVNCALFSIIYTKMFFDGFVHNRPGTHGPRFKRMLLNIGKLAVKP